MNLLNNVKITLVKAAQGAGTSAVESDSIDMANYEGVVFVGSIATANANNIANVAQSSDDGGSDAFADLSGTAVSPGDNGDQFKIDVYRPQERYVRLEIARGTSTATGDIYAIQYGPRVKPTSNEDAETHVSPDEGTA